MDPTMLGRLVCASKTPLGNERVLQVIIDNYKDEFRTFAATTFLHRDFEAVTPTDRCKQKVGRGRCRHPACKLSIAQFCNRHTNKNVNDWNIIGIRQLCMEAAELRRGQ